MMPLINPVALSLGPITVTWYGIILGLAALVGLLLAIREGKRFAISPEFFMDLLLIGVPAAVIGARIYYVAFEWDNYKHSFYEMIAIWHGGIAIHGALIGAVIAAIIYTRVKKVNFWRIADIAAPSLIAGQMIGRWGNFVNQEAHGGPVDPEFLRDTLHLPSWIVNHMEIDGLFFHPTFLYESIWNLGVLLVLLVLRRRPWLRSGELFMSYFALYSIGRFFIEGVRTDSLTFHGPSWLVSLLEGSWAPMNVLFEAGALPDGGGNVRTAQLISLLLVLAALAIIIWRRLRRDKVVYYADPVVFGKKEGGGNEGAGGDGKQDTQEQKAPSTPDGNPSLNERREQPKDTTAKESAEPSGQGKTVTSNEQTQANGQNGGQKSGQDSSSSSEEPKPTRYEPGNPFL